MRIRKRRKWLRRQDTSMQETKDVCQTLALCYIEDSQVGRFIQECTYIREERVAAWV